MAEITKVTTPIIPKENTAPKLKPLTDQAFELTDPSKVHKGDNEGRAAERQSESYNLLKDSMGRAAVIPLLKNVGSMTEILSKLTALVETGVSVSEAAGNIAAKELLESIFLNRQDVLSAVMQQDQSSVLFKGEAFDILRDIMMKFPNSQRVKDAMANLLKVFDLHVNSRNSVKNILFSANSVLDYMFSNDRAQFAEYLDNLAEMLLPRAQAEELVNQRLPDEASQGLPQQAHVSPETQTAQQSQQPQNAQQTQEQNTRQAQNPQQSQGQETQQAQMNRQLPEVPMQNAQQIQPQDPKIAQPPPETQPADEAVKAHQQPPLPQKEAVAVLKNNLLPLLGEIVVKYYQNEKMRDTVMVVVHNMVRLDQGTPESLETAVRKLAKELNHLANLPKNFEKQLLEVVKQNALEAKTMPNEVVAKITDVVEQALLQPGANPAVLRQAENMLISMIQNQSSLMDILHFVIPFQTPLGNVFSEVYVDPETDENVKGASAREKSHKIFISVETEAHGQFELCFLSTGEQVDFSMWCPEGFVESLKGMRKYLGNIMQAHGYQMHGFAVDKMCAEHNVAEVFPRLLNKKVGMDVHI